MTLVIARLQFEIRALARRAADELDEPPRTPHARQGQRRLGQGGDPPPRRGCRLSEIGRLSLATPTTQRNAETSRAFGGELARPPRCGHRKARDLRNDRAQPDMTQTFLKAIEGRLLVATFEIDDRSDFRSAWARAGAKRSDRSRHRRTFPRASAPRYRRRRGQPPPRRSRRGRHRRPHAAPQAQTANRKPRVNFSEPERQRGRHAPAPLFDLADVGAQDFDVRWGPRGLDGTLGLAFRACSLFKRFPESSRHIRSLRLRVSGADTKGFP